jgi:predicted RNA-binding Zn-ribbon protein involved in translation (DUF1610 family)
VRRNWNVKVACISCKKFNVVNDKTIGFQCPHCSKYNNVEKAKAQYESGDYIAPEYKGVEAASIQTTEGREYRMLRDEFEIRADMFAQGKSRNTMGADKFDRTLIRELKKNNCYRGGDKTGLE